MAKAAKSAAEASTAPTAGASTIDTATAARLCECSPEWIRKLAREGWIKKQATDSYVVVDVVQGVLRFMRDEARRTSKSAAASRVQDARAREIELKIAREEAALVDMADVEIEWQETLAVLRSEFTGCSASVTRDLDLRKKIDDYIEEAISRANDRFEKARATAFTDTEGAVEEDPSTS